ncbi:MAG: hypothetical protein QE484_17030 [Rhizobium sp.]|nr:hypothetical protein [Rhizobium sp.]
MGAALDMFGQENRGRITDEGRRAASNFAVSQLATALYSQNAFKKWEVQAIVDAYAEVLRKHGSLSEAELVAALHAHSIPKDLAVPLAKVLSRSP